MSSDIAPDVTALAINVAIPEGLRWTGTRRGEEFTLTTLNVRLLPDGRLAGNLDDRAARGPVWPQVLTSTAGVSPEVRDDRHVPRAPAFRPAGPGLSR